MSREIYVETDTDGPLFCPECGGFLGSVATSHVNVKHSCGATIELCVNHAHPDYP